MIDNTKQPDEKMSEAARQDLYLRTGHIQLYKSAFKLNTSSPSKAKPSEAQKGLIVMKNQSSFELLDSTIEHWELDTNGVRHPAVSVRSF